MRFNAGAPKASNRALKLERNEEVNTRNTDPDQGAFEIRSRHQSLVEI